MAKVKTAVASRKRKKRVLKAAKGQFGQRSKRYQQAKRSLQKGMAYSYRDRRVKKRLIKNLWVARLSAACKEHEISYSRFMNGLKKAEVVINKKMLSQVAIETPSAFKKLVELAQQQMGPVVKKTAVKKASVKKSPEKKAPVKKS